MRPFRITFVILLGVLAFGISPGQAQQKRLTSRYVKGEIPLDPSAVLWVKAPSVTVPLLAQVIAKPFNFSPSVSELRVRSLHNGKWIAFNITWKDETRNTVMYTDTFRDAVALMVPVGKSAPITMGAPKERVLVLHWKADWQEDIDKTFQEISQLYPNAWQDWYPFAVGEPPYDITAWTNPEARRYLTGWVVGNPRSQPYKRTAVEEQIAEGFSSLTTSERQSAVGKGVHAKGEWRVVITRPFVTGDPNDPRWAPGQNISVAFAAWDGARGEIGSRKGFSDWVIVRVAPLGR